MSLTFDLDLDVEPGRIDIVGPGIRRVVAPNAGPFTFKGTGTYIVGEGRVAVIDPGPTDDAHLEALVRALKGETVTHLVITHMHADHSPGARALRDRVGGRIVGCAPHPVEDEISPVDDSSGELNEEHLKEAFDREHLAEDELHDGDAVSGPGWTLEAIETPGHISNHLCFAYREADVIFSGDHVMRWSTSVISPPSGDLRAYLHSLDKVAARRESTYWPTHGPAVRDPHTYVPALAEHRRHRTAQVVQALSTSDCTISELVAKMYPGLDEKLIKAAGRSVMANIVALIDEQQVEASGPIEHRDTRFAHRGANVGPGAMLPR